MKTDRYLFGSHTPKPIPQDVLDDRVYNLKLNLHELSQAEQLDLVRIKEVQQAIEFWEKL